MQSAKRFVSTIVGVWVLALAASVAAVEQGDVAPPWNARNFSGQIVEFPALAAGKPAVVVFWATWCEYCRAFMPYLKQIQSDYAAYGVKIVAINTAEDIGGDPHAYMRDLKFAPVAIEDGDSIARAYGIEYIPGLLIVDGKGTVAYRRPWTDLPAGRAVAELWDRQVRTALNALVHR